MPTATCKAHKSHYWTPGGVNLLANKNLLNSNLEVSHLATTKRKEKKIYHKNFQKFKSKKLKQQKIAKLINGP